MNRKTGTIRSVYRFIKYIAGIFSSDRVSVYAAQATFFVIISTVPFISLVLSIVGIILPNSTPDTVITPDISAGMAEILGHAVDDLRSAPSISLLSISAIGTLWCSTRGITAIRDGIGSVYGSKPGKNYFSHRLISLFFTLLFVLFILLLILLILFGDFLIARLSLDSALYDVIIRLRTPFLIIVMTLFFTMLYSFVAQRSDTVRHGAVFHLPGGIFSAVGWIVFSYFYSLYIKNFPSASYIYGSLGALCLIMLWLYFCMIILLTGSEINKLLFSGKDEIGSKTEK